MHRSAANPASSGAKSTAAQGCGARASGTRVRRAESRDGLQVSAASRMVTDWPSDSRQSPGAVAGASDSPVVVKDELIEEGRREKFEYLGVRRSDPPDRQQPTHR